MRRLSLVVSVVTLAGLIAASASAVDYRFSVDIGSNEDISDPTTPADNWMDCGDIYLEGASYQNPQPTLVKDDTALVLPQYTGHPFLAAPQPVPTLLGAGTPGTDPSSVYTDYFDLDAEDQLGFEIYPQHGQNPIEVQIGWAGVYLEPAQIHFSYEDDGAPGWYINPIDVPTTAPVAHGSAATKDEIMVDTGPFGVWSPTTVTGVRDEFDLGLAAAPPQEADDDDVDALDIEEHRYFYWSPDHEANMQLDPGSIYITDLLAAGQNKFQIIDDVQNLGILESTDVDAWEFCAVTEMTYLEMFGSAPGAPVVLIGLYSVDSDDPDTLAVDESGGMNPNTIYASNLVGQSIALATYDEDIDALAVPEPVTLALLAVGGLLVLVGKRS